MILRENIRLSLSISFLFSDKWRARISRTRRFESRRMCVDKVLQLKPSVALTKSNNAMLYVRRRSDTFSIGTTIRYILPQRNFRASIPFSSSLFRVCVASSSASPSSSAFPVDAIGLVPSLRRSPQRASNRSLSSVLDARSLRRQDRRAQRRPGSISVDITLDMLVTLIHLKLTGG